MRFFATATLTAIGLIASILPQPASAIETYIDYTNRAAMLQPILANDRQFGEQVSHSVYLRRVFTDLPNAQSVEQTGLKRRLDAVEMRLKKT